MKALIVVDIQNDFCPGGALEVPKGDEIIPIANKVINTFNSKSLCIVATQDYHPRTHCSFTNDPSVKTFVEVSINNQTTVMWPPHCVQKTKGSQFHPDLIHIQTVFHKGVNPKIDGYSGFFDNDGIKSTGMDVYLKGREIKEVYILGLATDYCVKFTAIDAINLGFKTHVIIDACRGINYPEGSVKKAIEEMKQLGVKIILSSEIICGTIKLN